MTRTGVFLCTCDQKIAKNIQVDAIPYVLRGNHEVVVVSPQEHVCLPDGLDALRETIARNKLDHVVVAACPARFQENHLRAACVNAGIAPNNFALVDWREGCAYVHRGDKVQATGKAIDMLQMTLARVTSAVPVEQVTASIEPRVLVIGGGIAGLTAARSIAERGIPVTLVEQDAELGGRVRHIPLNGKTQEFETTRAEVLNNSRIDVKLNTRVVAVSGSVGAYRIELAERHNGNGNGSNGANGANHSTAQIVVGAVVIATGVQEYNDPHLYHHDGRHVVTLGEFEIQNLESGKRKAESGNAKFPEAIVYILCAGSRDERIPYCSNVCCLNALDQAIRVKRAHPETRVTMLFRDLYLLGDELNEETVLEARRLGIEFLRYAETHPPRVIGEMVEVRDTRSGSTQHLYYDRLVLATPLVPHPDAGMIARLFKLSRDEYGFLMDRHWRLPPGMQYERGIFICGGAHQPVDTETATMQALTAAAHATRFISRRALTRPAASARVDPKFCTGCAQCVETCAFDAITMLPHALFAGRGETGHETLDCAQIDPFLCLQCGNCVVACPSKAISLPNLDDAQIYAQIDAVLGRQVNKYTGTQVDRYTGTQGNRDAGTQVDRDTGTQEGSASAHLSTSLPVYLYTSAPVRLVFACHWSGFAAMELAGARRMQYAADTRVIELPCSARLDPMHVLYALLRGADKVLLALCPPDECHYANGNRFAEMRIENLRAQLSAHGIDPKRVRYVRMMGDDAGAWIEAVKA